MGESGLKCKIMFFGSYEYSIDAKGRLVLPSKMRSEENEKFYMIKGYDGCLSLYTEADFAKYTSRLQTLQFEKEIVRLHQRLLLSTVVEVKLDSHGRIQIPLKTLKDYNIGLKVMIIGVLDHIEIWNLETFNNYKIEHEKDFEKDAEAILKDEI